MPNLGNAWHIPGQPDQQLRGRGAMRDPIGVLVPGTAITIISGNQFQGAGGNPGNQLQTGSSVFFRRDADPNWTELPMKFFRTVGNNKYYAATIPANTSSTFQVGDVVQYYLRIPYSNHDTTFLHANDNGTASTPTESEAAARTTPFAFTVENSARWGQWGPVFTFPNVAIHTHVLPNGRVLMWGRRDESEPDNLDVHRCTPFVWDPANPVDQLDPTKAKTTNTPQPKLADGNTTVNLFCAGHAFLPDGRLLVAGGHNFDSDGLNQAIIYTPASPDSEDPGTWTPITPMGRIDTVGPESMRRWYPTATTLPDGRVMVSAGSYKLDPNSIDAPLHTTIPQVWNSTSGNWTSLRDNGILPLYPRMHVISDGKVFMSGTNMGTFLLDISNGGTRGPVKDRATRERQYAPAVTYNVDKVIYIGGGGGHGVEPTAECEIIDLNPNLSEDQRQWQRTNSMQFPRRQHNATLLPDGTVLVTGGTQGGGVPNRRPENRDDTGFNDLRPGNPVHIAELWDPKIRRNDRQGDWRELAAEEVDRCYHATAVLLPDARVLSAGGGEYRPFDEDGDMTPNPPEDSHRNAQIFSPPYLFAPDGRLAERPVITDAPDNVTYGQTFEVGTSQPDQIGMVSWIRLPSVTHAFDQSQRINFFPDFEVGTGVLRLTAPSSPNTCPPGHYMLFVLSNAGVPSIAKVIQIQATVAPSGRAAVPLEVASAPEAEFMTLSSRVSEPGAYLRVYAREAEAAKEAKGTAVVLGITGTCPYGIGSCWGGAYEALHRLEGVRLVYPVPNTNNSTAEVLLMDERLPELDKWDEQFHSIVNGSYQLRGVEVTVQGVIEQRNGQPFLAGSEHRAEVQLVPLTTDKIQWDRAARSPEALKESEVRAYDELAAASKDFADGQQVTVTGPLKQTEAGYQLHVRVFEA